MTTEEHGNFIMDHGFCTLHMIESEGRCSLCPEVTRNKKHVCVFVLRWLSRGLLWAGDGSLRRWHQFARCLSWIEERQMDMRRNFQSCVRRGGMMALAVAFTVTMFEQTPVFARDGAPAPQSAGAVLPSHVTDYSAAKRHRRHYSNNNAAAAAAFGAFAGMIGNVIVDQQRRDYYRDRYYDGGPYSYSYYGPGYGYYGPRYYGW